MKRACTPPGQSRTCEWAAVELEERERERKKEKREERSRTSLCRYYLLQSVCQTGPKVGLDERAAAAIQDEVSSA